MVEKTDLYGITLDEAYNLLVDLYNRKCEDCKYWNKSTNIDGNSRCNKLFNFRSYYDFYCKEWELKK